jgi:hypothetical protein
VKLNIRKAKLGSLWKSENISGVVKARLNENIEDVRKKYHNKIRVWTLYF